MATPQEQRRLRLRHDFNEMQNIQGSIVSWTPVRGTPPFVEEYRLEVNIHTVIGPGPIYRDVHIIKVTLPSTYPLTSAPETVMETHPIPYHPNWFLSGRWCYGYWDIAEGLGHHVVRMLRTLQYDKEITNPLSPANREANTWYLENLNRGWFPCDPKTLPDPTKKRFDIDSTRKTFHID